MDGTSKAIKAMLARGRDNALRSLVYLRPKYLVGNAGLAVLGQFYGSRAVPLPTILTLARLAGGSDVFAKREKMITDGSALRNTFLAEKLRHRELGYWSMGADVLNLLEDFIKSRRPKAVLEFGGGISTVCLAHYMREAHHDSANVLVYSVDQDLDCIQETARTLEDLSLSTHVRLISAPLAAQWIEGRASRAYDFEDETRQMLAEAQPELFVIDGPAGESGIRLSTLPMAMPWLAPGAHFFLDDAFRIAELDAAKAWSAIEGVRLAGIYLTGKGLLAGEVT